jgi:hypothetical protein
MIGEPWTRERLSEECSRLIADIQQDAALIAKLPAHMRRDIDAHVAALRTTEAACRGVTVIIKRGSDGE